MDDLTATTRIRRTNAQIEELDQKTADIVNASPHAMSARRVFYELVAALLVAKLDKVYEQVCTMLVRLRKAGMIPWEKIVDGLRRIEQPVTWESIAEQIEYYSRHFRRSLADAYDATVLIWCEKDSIIPVVREVCDEYDVALLCGRGFNSWSYLHEAAQHIAYAGKPARIFYLGDHDPSGCAIDPAIINSLTELLPDHDITLERIGILPEHIERFGLKTRPTKKTDRRAKGFVGESVELEAMDPDIILSMVENAILRHCDTSVKSAILREQADDRRRLTRIAEAFEEGTLEIDGVPV